MYTLDTNLRLKNVFGTVRMALSGKAKKLLMGHELTISK